MHAFQRLRSNPYETELEINVEKILHMFILSVVHALTCLLFLQQKSSGAGHKAKTKPKKGRSKRKTKTVARKGMQPEKPITHQSNRAAEAKEGTPGTSSGKAAAASIKAPASTQRLQTKTTSHLEKPQKAALSFLSALSTKYDVMLMCAQCFPQEAEQPQLDCQHACKETTLVLQEHGTTRYQRIRPIPFRPSLDKLCENFKNSIPCDEREKCPRPHTLEEQIVWKLSTSYHCTLPNFIEQLKQSSLRCTYRIWQLCREYQGSFMLCCSACLKSSSPTKYTKKKPHVPRCYEDHPWQPKLLFETNKPDEEPQRFETCRGGKNKHEKIANAVQKLLDDGFEKDDIIEESRKVSQSLNVTTQKNRPVNKQVQLLSESRERYASESSDDNSLSTNCAELTEMIGEIPYDGDVDAPGEVGDEGPEGDQEESSRSEYYEELSPNDLKFELKTHPKDFKECIIELEGPP